MPTLLSLILPHLPKRIAATLHGGFTYMQIGSFLLEDLAFAIFIVGTVVWVTLSLSPRGLQTLDLGKSLAHSGN